MVYRHMAEIVERPSTYVFVSIEQLAAQTEVRVPMLELVTDLAAAQERLDVNLATAQLKAKFL